MGSRHLEDTGLFAPWDGARVRMGSAAGFRLRQWCDCTHGDSAGVTFHSGQNRRWQVERPWWGREQSVRLWRDPRWCVWPLCPMWVGGKECAFFGRRQNRLTVRPVRLGEGLTGSKVGELVAAGG